MKGITAGIMIILVFAVGAFGFAELFLGLAGHH